MRVVTWRWGICTGGNCPGPEAIECNALLFANSSFKTGRYLGVEGGVGEGDEDAEYGYLIELGLDAEMVMSNDIL